MAKFDFDAYEKSIRAIINPPADSKPLNKRLNILIDKAKRLPRIIK